LLGNLRLENGKYDSATTLMLLRIQKSSVFEINIKDYSIN